MPTIPLSTLTKYVEDMGGKLRLVAEFPDSPPITLTGIEGYSVAQRSVFVIDGDGVVRWSWVSDSPLNEPSYDDVKSAVAAI